MKIVRNPNRWLTKLSRAAALISLVAGVQSATAQDEPFTYGRTPSGSASEVVDSNRHGLGVLFRGGHMAGDTVGRDDSISHISLAPYVNIDNSFLFGDTRLMRANEGGLAWTFGGGYRHYLEDYDIVLGANSYFDRSELTGAHLNQWGVGAEVMANGWEWRGNVYQTFGDTSSLVGQRVAANSSAFVGENITFTRIDTFASSLEGFDTETGFLLPGSFAERIDLRAFGGGYMYEGEGIDRFGGLSGRLQADIGRWLELGLKVTDDKQFHTTVMFSAAVHFGGFESQEHTKRSAIQRFREPVRRNMHVVALTADVAVGNQLAINPDTGLPFTVAHVNSNDAVGPFAGTVEDPFQLLTAGLAAAKDITFVHAGSVFNAPPENIVSLAANRKLIGEGFITANRDVNTTVRVLALGQSLNLTLPDSPTFAATPTLARPQLVGSAGDAVTLANNTQFSGFIVQSPTGNGIFSNGAAGTIISDVLVTGAGNSAILLQNTTGTTSITDTTLIASATATGPTFHVNGGNGQISFRSTDDNFLATITNTSPQSSLLIENMTGGLIDMTNSSITEDGGRGILIQNNTGGNAIVDNVSISNSLGTGISILNSDGVYTFRKSSAQLQQITIDNATQQGILIDDAGGTINFAENLLISNRNAEGIEVLNSAGDVRFSNQVTIADLGAGIGAQAAVSVHDQLNGGSVTFGDDLIIRGTVRGSLGNGILLTNNDAGSIFTVNDNTTIVGTNLASVAIANNDGLVRFEGQTTINQRLVEGVAITNSSGAILFGETNNDATTVTNELASQDAAILATNNAANITFANAIITNAQGNLGGGAGIHLVGNTGDVNFGTMNVNSIDGVGLFGLNNQKIGASGGAIDSTGAAAVNIENTGIDITLTSVTSTGSPDYGIRLVETNKDTLKTFEVNPANQNVVPGDGGTIDGAKGDGLDNNDAAGVFLQNAGQVFLRGMVLSDNEFGVRIRNTETTPGLADSTKQSFTLDTSIVQDSDIRGLDSQNLMGLEITDSTFDNNGDDAAAGRESILLDYTVRLDPDTITRVDQADDPFIVLIQDSDIISNSGDAIRVVQSDTAANGSVMRFEMFRNTVTVNDTLDSTGTSPFDNNRILDDGVVFTWNGPVWAKFENNQFDMTSAEQQQAISFRNSSTTDQTLMSIQSNAFTVSNVSVNVGAVDIRADGPSIMNSTEFQISGNDFDLDDGAGVNIGGRPIGLRMTLASNAGVSLLNNDIVFQADGGTGILFNRVAASSNFVISGNRIGFADLGTAQERGIIFSQVTGIVNLFGNVDNQVVVLQNAAPGNGAVEQAFSMPAGSNNGQIIVNGVLVP